MTACSTLWSPKGASNRENTSATAGPISCTATWNNATVAKVHMIAVELRPVQAVSLTGNWPKVVNYHQGTVNDASNSAWFQCGITVCLAGVYRATFNIFVTAGCTGGTVLPNIAYVNDGGAVTLGIVSTPVNLTTANNAQGYHMFYHSAASPIVFSTTGVTCTSGGPVAAQMRLSIERLQ